MPVSANTLFHFTRLNTIKKILESREFWPQYSLEHFQKALPRKSSYKKTYIPMVCFCDLKLTQLSDKNISKHTMHFGNYGIGFKKNWGVNKKISPVVYVHENSIASMTIDTVIKRINEADLTIDSSIAENLGEIVKFLKPYEGYWQKNKRKSTLINYYDEREWRYIPKEKKYRAFPVLDIRPSKISSLNRELQAKPLKFQPKDIKYIIIDKEEEKQTIAKSIENMDISKSARVELITKIITLDEIKSDF